MEFYTLENIFVFFLLKNRIIMLQEGGEWWKSLCYVVAEIKTIFIHGKMVEGETTTDGEFSLQQFAFKVLSCL